MAKRPSYSNIYIDALLESIEEVKQKTAKAGPLLNYQLAWYLCVAEDSGKLIVFAPGPHSETPISRDAGLKSFTNMSQLASSKKCDLSRELGAERTGAVRAGGRIFSLSGNFTLEIAEMLMVMVAIKVDAMTKDQARALLQSAPHNLADERTDVEWIE